MTYELAKELKDAGFWRPNFPKISPLNGSRLTDEQMIVAIQMTTLSELIEACGNKFSMLTKRKDCWAARSMYQDRHTNIRHGLEEGKTPEEAVAKLWLALQK
jgi:hypothetical protein